jgi:inorganic pyrophosphatase
MNLIEIPSFHRESGALNVIIETPRGSRNKYSYDPELQIFKLKKVLTLGAVFPFDFGFVPSTLGDDGDPLDVLVIMDEPAFPGCLVRARLIGNIQARQKKMGKKNSFRNDRLIAFAEKNLTHCEVNSLGNLNAEIIDQMEHFFISYNRMEGKEFKPIGRDGSTGAKKRVQQGQRKFQAKLNSLIELSNRHR